MESRDDSAAPDAPRQAGQADNLDEYIVDLVMKFKLSFYRKVLQNFQERKASLTADEAYCVEAIYSLGTPTVGEFATYVGISPQSAAYKVGNLVRKGYIVKTQGSDDKREFLLSVTDRFMDYFAMSNDYIFEVAQRIREEFPLEDQCRLEEMLGRINRDLMPEIAHDMPYTGKLDDIKRTK